MDRGLHELGRMMVAMRIKAMLFLLIIGAVMTSTPSASAATVPTTADAWTALFQAKNDRVWSGGDQGTSLRYGGRVYWAFGDTMLGTEDPDGSYGPGAVMVSNSILVQNGQSFANAVGSAQPAVPDPAPGERYWTQGMVVVGGYLYVMCQRVRNTTDGFELMGVELAKFSIHTSTGKLTLVAMVATPSSGVRGGAGVDHIQWSADALVWGNFVYMYGFTSVANNPYVIHTSYVARSAISGFPVPASWQYFKRSTHSWVATMAELDPVTDPTRTDALMFSQISSVRQVGDKFVLATKPWNNWGETIEFYTSPNPYGPWKLKTTAPSPAGVFEGKVYETYSPQLHPEQPLANGNVLFSVSWNGRDLASVMDNADLFKIRFYDITL